MGGSIIEHLTAKGFDCAGFDDRLYMAYQQAKGLFGYFSFEDKKGYHIHSHISELFTEAPEQYLFAGHTGYLGHGYSRELEGSVFRLALDYSMSDPSKSFGAIYDFPALPSLRKCEALARLIHWRSGMTGSVEANRQSFETVLLDMLAGFLSADSNL